MSIGGELVMVGVRLTHTVRPRQCSLPQIPPKPTRRSRAREFASQSSNQHRNAIYPYHLTITDPLTGTANSVGVATISNANLTPEIANSLTGGFVWTPSFLTGFSLSVDGFRVTVDNAIAQLAGNSSSVLNLCRDTAGTNSACSDVITRPFPYSNTTAANFPTALFKKWLTIASFETYGVDVESNYKTRLWNRDLSLRALVSYQPHLIFN